MNQTQITKCPKCDTTFRVTPAQLQAAKGAVRCGACLHVFRANQHFIAEEEKQSSPSQDDRTQDLFGDAVVEPKSAPQPAMKDSSIDDDFLIDDDNGLIDDGDDLFEKDAKASTIINDIDEKFLSINPDEVEDPFFSDSEHLKDTVKETDDDDEAWAQALLDDNDDEQPRKESKPAAKPSPLVSTVAQTEFTYIEDDPLDLSLPEKRNMVQIWGFGISSVFMLLLLIAQMAYFNFDQWARLDQYRPWYQIACHQLNCRLPSTFDLSKIRTTASPQVSSHPEFQNALMVDVLFMNGADYEQPFPKLELSFSDSNDKTIARRIFTPDEYLAGEAAGLSLMPQHTPIHIALEIKDPGKRASNYQVQFLNP
jgi:predicted Zn finger-like uncharacterized protein